MPQRRAVAAAAVPVLTPAPDVAGSQVQPQVRGLAALHTPPVARIRRDFRGLSRGLLLQVARVPRLAQLFAPRRRLRGFVETAVFDHSVAHVAH